VDIFKVVVSKKALKELNRLPNYIVLKLPSWIEDIGECGLHNIQKIPGFHDEPLKGNRKGQRSIRLSKAYRAIYVIDNFNMIHLIEVIEVNKHDY
jgi:proteic killer suppression protein